MSLLTPVVWSTLSKAQQDELLMRPAVLAGVEIAKTVDAIVKDVRERGDAALREYAAKFDRIELKEIRVSPDAINEAETRLDADTKAAMQLAVKNIVGESDVHYGIARGNKRANGKLTALGNGYVYNAVGGSRRESGYTRGNAYIEDSAAICRQIFNSGRSVAGDFKGHSTPDCHVL